MFILWLALGLITVSCQQSLTKESTMQEEDTYQYVTRKEVDDLKKQYIN